MFSGNDIGGLPRHYLSANLDYRYSDFVVGVNVRGALGSSYADHANTQKMGSYAVLVPTSAMTLPKIPISMYKSITSPTSVTSRGS
ncbi:hypothetical protein OURE66S_00184 [Oligella ureolytica]